MKKEYDYENQGAILTETIQRFGKWTLRENMRYLLFLEEFIHLFKDEETRKKNQVFSRMMKFIRSRKTSQCKSHHQKMLKIYKTSESIIEHLS